MNTKTKCLLCPKNFISSGAYENHIHQKHPELIPFLKGLLAEEKSAENPQGPSTGLRDTLNDLAHDYMPTDVVINEQSNGSNTFPTAGEPICAASELYAVVRQPGWNPWAPFKSLEDFKLARFFIMSKTPKGMIDQYFRDRLHPASEHLSFTSGHTLHKMMKKMTLSGPPGFASGAWRTVTVLYQDRGSKEVWMRNPLDCIKFLLAQRTFAPDLIWAPIQETNEENEMVYRDIHTSDWWWHMQV